MPVVQLAFDLKRNADGKLSVASGPRNQHKSLLSVRVRAAIEAVPFESPRLSASAVLQGV
jgi:hypothetical protein